VRLMIVNAGSSSLKLNVLDDDLAVLADTDVEDWSGDTAPLDKLAQDAGADAVVHRVVHGGDEFAGAVVATTRWSASWSSSCRSRRCTSRGR